MTLFLPRFAIALLAVAALALPAAAAIVRAKYEGEINRIGAATPPGFSLGERVWGEFAYNTESENHGDDFMPQYPAVRMLTVQTASGFFASINTGTISAMLKSTPGSLNQPATLQFSGFQLTSLPPISLGRESHTYNPILSFDDDLNGNLGGNQAIYVVGPDGEMVIGGIVIDFGDLYHFYWVADLDAAYAGYLESVQLGFPLPAGAFIDNPPFILSLALGDERLEGSGLPLQPFGLDPTLTSTGKLYFNYWPDTQPEFAVEFNITSLTVIPEPSTLAILLAGILSLASRCGRRRFV